MQQTLTPILVEKKLRKYEKPSWAQNLATVFSDDLTDALPTDAVHQGYRLRMVEYDYSADPVLLYDRNRRIVYEWGYIPSLMEVFEVCKEIT